MIKKILILFLITPLVFGSCKKDDDTPQETSDIKNTYSGSASHGDLMTFEINQSKKTYQLDNETTGRTETGSYTVNSLGNTNGLYTAKAGGESFFAVELDDKIIACNFPSGNASNEISFGVSSEIDNSGKESELAGNYLYVRMGQTPINGSTKYKEWGAFTLTASGQIHLLSAASGGTGDYDVFSPEEVDLIPNPLPITSQNADESGTWFFHGSKKGQVSVSMSGMNYSGYAYVAGNESVFLMDLGTGQGFALAYKITNNSLTTVAGDYKFVDTWNDGTIGAGNYTISPQGIVSYYHIDKKGVEERASFGPLTKLNTLSNVYMYNDTTEMESYYLVIVGDAIMHFIFNDQGEYHSYGAGAKI